MRTSSRLGLAAAVAPWTWVVLAAAGAAAGATAGSAAGGAAAPRDEGIVERIEVRESQVHVTAWPKDGDVARCGSLTKDDFVLEVDGVPRPIRAVLRLGEQSVDVPGGKAAAVPPATGLKLVVLIDEFHHSCPACAARLACCAGGATGGAAHLRHRAYESARSMLREQFRPGDRVLIATIAYWPRAHTGWMETADEAIGALDRLEATEKTVTNGLPHVRNWFDGMVGFFRALDRFPGTKDVLFPTCHFQLGADDAEEIRELAAVAQRADVVLHTIDILSCACFGSQPVGPLAINLGGQRFGAAQGTAGAVEAVRRVAGCRFLVAFEPPATRRGRIGHSLRVEVRTPGFSTRAPATIADAGSAPTAAQEREAMLLLPRIEAGLAVDLGFWPLRPDAKARRWDGLLIAQVTPRPLTGGTDDVRRITVQVVAGQEGHKPIERGSVLDGAPLRTFLAGEDGRSFAFKVALVPGAADVAVVVHGEGASASGSVRRTIEVPPLPAWDRPGPWFLARRVRLEGEIVAVPLSGVVLEGDRPAVLGLSCGDARFDSAMLVHDAGRAGQVVALAPVRARSIGAPAGCRWLSGATEEGLAAGRWSLIADDGTPAFEFTVQAAD